MIHIRQPHDKMQYNEIKLQELTINCHIMLLTFFFFWQNNCLNKTEDSFKVLVGDCVAVYYSALHEIFTTLFKYGQQALL